MGWWSQAAIWKNLCVSTSDKLPKEISEERDLN